MEKDSQNVPDKTAPVSTPTPSTVHSPPTRNNKLLIISGLVLFALLVIAILIYFRKPVVRNDNNIITQNTNEPNPKIEVLATLPPEDSHVLYTVPFDPNRSTVYAINKDQYTASSSATVVINGKPDKTYREVDLLTVSPDGKRAAYVAKEDDKEFVVVDGVEGKKYDYIKNLKFSPDNLHIAYAAGEGRHVVPDSKFSAHEETNFSFIVVDAAEGKKYDGTYVESNLQQTYDPSFSKDGKKVTYTGIKNGKNIIVVDDKELSDYANEQYPQFIGSSYDVVYLVSENNTYFLVTAGEKRPIHNYISDINGLPYFIGKDSSQLAYEATDKDIRSVIVNDASYPITSGVLQDLTFSNSGKYTAYYTGTWMSKDLFINGKRVSTVQQDATTTVGSPLFSPDEQFLVYSDYNQKDQNSGIHIISPDSLLKLVDFPLPGFKVIGVLKFSDNGKFLYFKGWQGRKIVFVTLNVEQLFQDMVKGKLITP